MVCPSVYPCIYPSIHSSKMVKNKISWLSLNIRASRTRNSSITRQFKEFQGQVNASKSHGHIRCLNAFSLVLLHLLTFFPPLDSVKSFMTESLTLFQSTSYILIFLAICDFLRFLYIHICSIYYIRSRVSTRGCIRRFVRSFGTHKWNSKVMRFPGRF